MPRRGRGHVVAKPELKKWQKTTFKYVGDPELPSWEQAAPVFGPCVPLCIPSFIPIPVYSPCIMSGFCTSFCPPCPQPCPKPIRTDPGDWYKNRHRARTCRGS